MCLRIKKKNTYKISLTFVPNTISSGKYDAVVMADLGGAFDAVWRNGALYRLHKAG